MTVRLLVLLAALLAAAGASAETLRDGDRARMSLDPSGEVREIALEAAAASRLRIRTAGEASLVLLDPEGIPVAASEARSPGRGRLAVEILPATGRYRLLLEGAGEVRVKVRARPQRKIRVEGVIPEGGELRLPFAATPGSLVEVRLRGEDGVRPDLSSADIPGDGEVPLRPVLLGARVRIEGVPVPGLGDGVVVVTAREGTSGAVEGTIRVRSPRETRTVEMPPADGAKLGPGGNHLVLGADGVSLDGEPLGWRVRGARVLVLDGFGPDGKPRRRADVVLEIESAGGGLVAWVLACLRDPVDLRPGEMDLRDPRIEMLHVVTNLRGLLYSTVVPPISGPRSGSLWLERASPAEGDEVEGTLDGEVERTKDGRRIELRSLPVRAVVERHTVRAVL